MRIVFIGTVEFSLSALDRLLEIGAEVVGVCTGSSSSRNSDYVDLGEFCRQHEIPCLRTSDINSNDAATWIKGKSPDVIFCFGWSALLKAPILNVPPLGVVGFHPAALPQNRGRHPLIWALALGLDKTASTFFFMDEGADSGRVLSQREIRIGYEDDARSLYDKMTKQALKQIDQFVPQLEAGTYRSEIQNESHSSTWRKRGIADGCIDWRMTAGTIYNLVRALTKPYLGAHFELEDGQNVKVWKVKIVDDASRNIEPGKIIGIQNGGYVIKCGGDAICLSLTEPKLELEVGTYL